MRFHSTLLGLCGLLFSMLVAGQDRVTQPLNLPAGQTGLRVFTAWASVGVPQPNNPKIFSKPAAPGEQPPANYCKNFLDMENMWCFNQPVNGQLQSMTFRYKFLTAGIYYIGMYYATAQPTTYMKVLVDGAEKAGYMPTPSTGAWDIMKTTAAEFPLNITLPKLTQIQLIMMFGRVNVEYLIVSTTPIESTAPTPPPFKPNLPTGAVIVPANTFTSAVGFPNPSADQFYERKAEVNFCFAKENPSVRSWCMNGPINGTQISSLTFMYNFATAGQYFFGARYATNATASRLKIFIDGVESFGYLPTPFTGGVGIHVISGATQPATIVKPGVKAIKLVVAMGRIDLNYFIISPSAIASNPTTEPAPPTKPLPAGAQLVMATSYASAVGVPAPEQSDQTFPGKAVTNFCLAKTDPSIQYWCINGPDNTTSTKVLQSLTFKVNFAKAGTYYLGVNYGSTQRFTVMNVFINGQQNFGYVPTPLTGARDLFQTAVSTQPAVITQPGVQEIQFEISKGSLGLASFIVSPEPITITTATVAPISTQGPMTIVQASSYVSAVGTPNPEADQTWMGAASVNFCRNAKNPAIQYWCYNQPVNQVFSSLTFNYNFVNPGTYYFGLKYATSNPIAVVQVLLDGVRSWGYMPTPTSGGWINFVQEQAVKTVVINTPGVKQITIVVSRGSVSIESFIISPKPIPKDGPNPYMPRVMSPGEWLVEAENYVGAVGVPSIYANPYFPGKDTTNFCISHINPTIEYWCLNNPIQGSSVSSLTFHFKFPTAGTYYFSANYATNSSRALLNVYLNGVQSFGFFQTPPTGHWEKFERAVASQGTLVKQTSVLHTIELEVASGKINVDSFVISNSPMTSTITTPEPEIPTTAPGGIVLQYIGPQSGSSGVSTSAVVAICVGAAIFMFARQN